VRVAGFPLEEGARLIAEEIRAFDPDSLDDVRFITYGDDSYETVSDVADAVRSDDA